MEHVVQPSVAARPLQGQDVQGLFDHADDRLVALVIVADGAGVGVGDVLADGAEDDLLLDLEDGLGQGLGLFGERRAGGSR